MLQDCQDFVRNLAYISEHFPENVFGTWGTDWPNVTINGFIDRKLAISRQFVADPVPTNLEIIPDLGDKEYLKTVEEALQICSNFNPDLVLFQAGVDALETDALGLLKVTREGMKKRNEMVFDTVLSSKIPMVIFMGGGYSKPIEHTVDSFCDLFLKAAEVNQQILNP